MAPISLYLHLNYMDPDKSPDGIVFLIGISVPAISSTILEMVASNRRWLGSTLSDHILPESNGEAAEDPRRYFLKLKIMRLAPEK